MKVLTRKARFTLRLLIALVTKYYLAILIGFILSLVVIFVSPLVFRWISQWQKTQKIGIIGRYSQANIPINIQQKISFGLTTLSSDGLPKPGIAKSWEIKDDGKTYIFTIDNLLRWHDGTLVDSADIKYNFQDVTIDYPDSQHLVVKLKEPFSPLLVAVSRPVFKKALIGVGDYYVERTRKNGQILETLTLNSSLKNKAKIIYYFYVSNKQAQTAFKLGLVNQILNVNEIGDFVKWPNVHIASLPQIDQYLGLFLNTTQLDKNLRLALAYAINKTIWDNRVLSPLSPNSWAYTNEVKKYDYDLDRARQLLKKSGKIPPNITISVSEGLQSIAEVIKKDWQELGLKVDLQPISTLPTSYQVLLVNQIIPIDPDQYNLWHSGRTANLSNLDNKRIDKLLEDGRKFFDLGQRKIIYQSFQRFLLEEIPVIFLFHPTTYTITRN